MVEKYDGSVLSPVLALLKSTKSWFQESACGVVEAAIQTKIDILPALLDQGCIQLLSEVLLADDTDAVEKGLLALATVKYSFQT